MNCEFAHERIVTAAYGELPDEQAHELERHMAACPDCNNERNEMLTLKVLLEAHPVMEPAANLIARSRQRLEEALDAIPPKRWYERLGQRIMNNFASLQGAPVAACLLIIVGMGAGSLVDLNSPRVARRTPPSPIRGRPSRSPSRRSLHLRQRLPASRGSCACRTAILCRCAITGWCRSR